MNKNCKNKKNEKGFTLLEYCAGAAALVAIVYGSMTTLGGSMSTSFSAIDSWVKTKVTSNIK